jgi:MoaA/NifB/PqqE/SkfB family radical SAM enzyme
MPNDQLDRTSAWTRHAFRDFVAQKGGTAKDDDRRQEELFSAIATWAQQIADAFAAARADPAQRRTFAELLSNVCGWIDNGRVWHRALKFRSYVDVSLKVKALRAFVDHLAPTPAEALVLTTWLLEASPDARPALLVHAELLLEQGALDAAIETAERALRVQAVCQSAQELVLRAVKAKRDSGSAPPHLAERLRVLDYDLTDKFCAQPFAYLATGWKGAAYPCACPAWVPYEIGNVLQAESADAVWNSEAAVEIRRSILDGDFSYCSRTLCSIINAQKLPTRAEVVDPVMRGYIDNHTTTLTEAPRLLQLNYDSTCNLACPSCRSTIIGASAEDQDAFSRASARVILPLLKRVKGGAYISGGGEAFSSKHYRSVLAAMNPEEYPTVKIFLITNALLITPAKWREFPRLEEMVSTVSVSIDAAYGKTYEKLRPPGRWSTLMSNLEFLADLRRAGKIPSLWINFVVQKENYREMREFVALGERLGVDKIWFQKMANYGTFDQATFAKLDVCSPAHPEHAELLAILHDPVMKGPRMNMNMLMSLAPDVYGEEPLDMLW